MTVAPPRRGGRPSRKERPAGKMNPGTETRKPLRARKTMALSNRKQVELLGKMKAVLAGKGAVGEKRPVEAIGPCPGAPDKREQAETGAGQEPPPAKDPLASLVVNSEISIYKDPQEMHKELPNPDVKQFLNAGALQDILWHWYEKESGSPLLKPVKVSLESGPAGQLPDQLPIASSTHEIAATDAVAKTPFCQTLPVLQPEERHFQVPETDRTPAEPLGDRQRKRAASNSEEDVLSKRTKASGDPAEGTTPTVEKAESRLGKVQRLIQNQLEASMRELDQGLRHLNERIDHTQCLRKHEGIAIKIVKKISRLDRHINAVISFQRTALSQKVHQPRALAEGKILNGATLPPNTAVGKPVPPKKPTSTEILSSIAERSPGADVVPCVEVPKQSSGVPAAGAPAHPLKAAAGYADPPGEQDALVIDLTDEENNPDKEKKKLAGSTQLGQESQTESLPQPAGQSPSQVPPRFSHLPPLPSVEPNPAHSKDLRDTLPPQKLELVVAQVNQPKGIALQWNISRVDPRCAPIESFSLFICLEDLGSGTTSEWRRTSVLKALPLPMACSLSQFPRPARCYFTMQSKDIHGRYGPFCEVQSISAL
ncbi:activating transcription factor 7-interacting protein 2 isoform X2 [Crotalus tigris]|uniref:activating transcription factor 7-interacting protein 2 isoform X2 n=1 Tax=Crotalus tigris TaxID=88082 RepID=UPI00192F45E4|nr:activating transcription factor 7-interacting protein 2 isoform X2 [Crotalus tigris]